MIPMLIKKSTILLLSLFSFNCSVISQSSQKEIMIPENMEERIDELFSEWEYPESPGASVAVMHKGEILFSNGYGSANLEYDIPNTPSTIFHIASISKQFTAFSILLLQEEGRLSIDDDIRKYIPEVPDFGHTITLRHLVTHTSGMRDQWNLLAMAGWRLDDVITKEHVLSVVSHQKELNFVPGTQYTYCNTGFTLLAEVVSRVTKMPFAEFTQKKIFQPLQMDNTLFYDDHMKIVKNRAYSYQTIDDGFRKRVLSYANVGATSLFTTVEDLMKWAHNFTTAKVGSQDIFEQMNTEALLNDGTTFGGAMGQFITPYKGQLQIQHGGADAGYRTYFARFPEFDFAVAVFSNLGEFNPNALSLAIADLFIPDAASSGDMEGSTTPSDQYEYITLPTEELQKYEASYWNEEGSYSRRIYLRNDTLRYSRGFNESPLAPISENQFRMLEVNVELIVTFNNESTIRSMSVVENGSDPIRSEEFVPPNYSASDLEQFAGDYFSEELNTNYTLSVTETGLVATHFRHEPMQFTELKEDRFRTNQWYFGNIRFTRDDNGEVNGFKASNGRVMNLHFDKRE